MSTDQKQDLARLPDVSALRRIRMLLLDVDGVLTDGRIHFDPEGREYKSFHTRDAAGLVYWHRSGHLSGFLSGRGGHVVEMRAKQLGIHEPVLNRVDKERAFEEILVRQKLDASEVAYVGDDLLDLPVLRRVGFSATVADGAKEVRDAVHFTTRTAGGFGAVREVIELLLQQKGLWDAIVQRGGLG